MRGDQSQRVRIGEWEMVGQSGSMRCFLPNTLVFYTRWSFSQYTSILAKEDKIEIMMNAPIVEYLVATWVERQAWIVDCFKSFHPRIECFRNRRTFAESHTFGVDVLDANYSWLGAYFVEEMFADREGCAVSGIHWSANHWSCITIEVVYSDKNRDNTYRQQERSGVYVTG